jgi:hypothetical protein
MKVGFEVSRGKGHWQLSSIGILDTRFKWLGYFVHFMDQAIILPPVRWGTNRLSWPKAPNPFKALDS